MERNSLKILVFLFTFINLSNCFCQTENIKVLPDKVCDLFKAEFSPSNFNHVSKIIKTSYRIINNKENWYEVEIKANNLEYSLNNFLIKPKGIYPVEKFTELVIPNVTDLQNTQLMINFNRGFFTIVPKKSSGIKIIDDLFELARKFDLHKNSILLYDYVPSNGAAWNNIKDIFSRAII